MNDWTLRNDNPREEDLDAECAAEMAREAQAARRQREDEEEARWTPSNY